MENEKNDVMQNTTKEVLLMTIKDKLVELVARNIAKEKYGNPNKAMEFYIEAEDIFKDLLLRVLIEKSKNDPLDYITFLENVEELCDLDYYDVWFLESVIFN